MKGHEYSISSTVFPENHNLAILGHELNNVLNGLLGMVELLSSSGLTAEQGRWLKAIEYSGRQMESLIRSDWLSNNINQPACTQHRERVDGIEMLEQVVTSHTPMAHSRKNRLVLATQPELARLWFVDACLVRQLLDNLIGNAIKFTQSGEIVVDVSSVRVDGKPEGAIRFGVGDSGPGLDVASVHQVFTAYHRCGDSGKSEVGNRGLGLYICRQIVLAMGGTITCSNPTGGGARFEVILPGALCIEETYPPAFRSTLLDRLWCQLQLDGALRLSIANLLTRLGVRFSSQETPPPEKDLGLLISEAPLQWADHPPSLLLVPCTNSGIALDDKVLEAPLLESNLSAMLLEIALEWRSIVLRNENPDSIPKRL